MKYDKTIIEEKTIKLDELETVKLSVNSDDIIKIDSNILNGGYYLKPCFDVDLGFSFFDIYQLNENDELKHIDEVDSHFDFEWENEDIVEPLKQICDYIRYSWY